MDNSVVLHDETVSRRHARISFEDGRYYLTDESSNGTLIYNRDLLVHGEKVELIDGDVLRMGDHELRVRITAAEDPAPDRDAPAAALRGNSIPVSSDEEEPGKYPYAKVRSAEQAKGPALRVKELSIDDFFKDTDEADISKSLKVQPNKDASPGGVLPASKKQGARAYPEGRMTDEFLKELDGISNDIEDLHSTELAGELTGSASGVEAKVREASSPLYQPEAESRHADLEGEPVSETSKVSGQIREAPEEVYRELLDRFLKGAGLENSSLTNKEIPDLMESLGGVFRELVNGLWTVLRGRAELKAEIRIAMTMVRSTSNNPLKFSPTLEDAVKHLLKRDHPSFLEPIDAVRESFDDIENHQLALHAGIQASLVDALDHLDPERFSEKHKDSSILHTKSKFWKAYCEAYPELKEDALEGIFGKAFVRAYQDQLEKLRIKKTRS
jgi:type VI secretion system protein ImpI/type VI secretion system protein